MEVAAEAARLPCRRAGLEENLPGLFFGDGGRGGRRRRAGEPRSAVVAEASRASSQVRSARTRGERRPEERR